MPVEDMYGIDFNTILGAQGGGQNLADMISGLAGTLMTGGYMGTGAQSGAGQTNAMNQLIYHLWSDPSNQFWTEENPYTLQNVASGIGSMYPDQSDWATGMQSLSDLLNQLNVYGPDSLVSRYGEDIGEVRSQMGSEMKGLTTGLMGGKAGRYGGLGTMARNLGQGGRQQYMADIYGLQQEEAEMTSEMQQGLQQNFMDEVSNWMSFT